jgi:Spy/CpxP family protein refolding chaperone
MRAMKVFRAATLTLVATLVTATALYAANPQAAADPKAGADRTSRWESHLKQKLSLSDDQVLALRQVYASRDVEAQRQHYKALHTAQAELRRLALNGADDKTLAAKQTEVQNLLAQSMQMRVQDLKQVGPILNADQREAFAKMMERGPRGHHHRGAAQQQPS